jgi:hypothetical protein
MQLSLANVIRISVSEAQAGVGQFNTSNLAYFTREVPADSFGDLGYKIYLDPSEVATDFGTGSTTFQMVTAGFAQQPNMLTGGGYVVVILFADTPDVSAVQHITFSGAPASGTWELKQGEAPAGTTSALAYNADATAVQTALRLLTGYSSVTVVGNYTDGFTVTFAGVAGPVANLLVVANSLQTSAPANVIVTVATTTAGSVLSTETLVDAITRTKDLVQYFGLMATEITGVPDMLDAAALVQALVKMAFFMSNDSAMIAPGGGLDQLTTGSYTHSRGLYYGDSDSVETLRMASAYAARALSTDFAGSNTTSTMHLKDLKTIEPDPTMNQTLLNQAVAAGADTYVSLQGVPKTFTSGANRYFDQVYNQLAFVADLTVAQFNYLAETPTKIPQTEAGMDGMKSASRSVCKQYVTNGYLAPGTWNSPTTFGNQVDFLLNISQRGYYIYSQPISQQLQAAREAREAPLQQIALKEAGAMQSADTIVYINA